MPHPIERLFKIKQCRRIATRYDNLAANYLAFVRLASIRIWLRANKSARWFTRTGIRFARNAIARVKTPGAEISSRAFPNSVMWGQP
jgi:ribosomal protein L16/L10AE